MNHAVLIMLAVAVDIAVTFAIVLWVMKKRGMIGLFAADLSKVKSFSDSVHDLTANYLRSNYSGDADSLHGVLDGLLAQLDQKAQEQGLTLDRNALKMVLMRALTTGDIVPMKDAMAALKKVA